MCVPQTGLQAASVAPLQRGTAPVAVPALHQNTNSPHTDMHWSSSISISSNNCIAAAQQPPTTASMQAVNQPTTGSQWPNQDSIVGTVQELAGHQSTEQHTNQQNSMLHYIQVLLQANRQDCAVSRHHPAAEEVWLL